MTHVTLTMADFQYKTSSRDGIRIRYSGPIKEEEYMKTAHEFLRKLIREFARLSRLSFRKRIGATYFPYLFTERRLDSAVLPALSNICDGVVLTELPVERSSNDEEVHRGRVDYWCVYKGYTFVIEMKGAHAIFKGNKVKAREHSVKGRWREMVKQLVNVKEDCEYNLDERTKGIVRLGLHFITSMAKGDTDWDAVDEYRKDINDRLESMRRDIAKRFNNRSDYTPDFAAAWLIPDDMIECCDFGTYPGVILFAKILPPLRHKHKE